MLIHGTNGMGKTSILSALELGLTGKIAHLAADSDGYRSYITTLDTGGGSIALTTTAPHRPDAGTEGSLAFSDTSFTPAPLLDQKDARFFAERCYLPQATLGRLLELYDDKKTDTTSPLTLFVKELLGLDPLDALVDGLYPAFNVARVRNLVPAYRKLEALRTSLQDDLDRQQRVIAEAGLATELRLTALNETLAALRGGNAVAVTAATDISGLRRELDEAHDADRTLTELSRRRSEVRGLRERWQGLPSADASRDQASKERDDQAATQAFATWRNGPGSQLDQAIAAVRTIFADIPRLDDEPAQSRDEAMQRAEAETERCDRLLAAHDAATERVSALNAIVQRASVRIDELNKDLAGAAEDAKSLANALAGIVPHIEGESCPVCDRDFGEQGTGPLSTHVAAKIASLTSEAGRLQALTTERAGESTRLATAQRDLLSAGSGQMSAEDYAELTVRKAQMADLAQRLRGLEPVAAAGAKLKAEAAVAREALMLARRRDELSVSLLPEIEVLVQAVTARPASDFPSIDQALVAAEADLDALASEAEQATSLRIRAISELDLRVRDLRQGETLETERQEIVRRLDEADQAIRQVEHSRDQAKKVSDAADRVRSRIVKKVFNTSLNKVWRDLFVRLAPSEQFVPAFKLPAEDGGKVEAVLETLHRSGKASGSPGSMLSQGNLNTAALTLFLALHLSVPARMPWLVLDDPVQSMDDVHTAQFAALLRTLAKGMNRQVVIAVHERALFDYLTLELSPAFPGDSLIAVEVTRNFDGEAVAMPRAFSFEQDRAIAA